MAAILCLDFDDTVVLENLTRGLLERFADPGWRAFEQAYKDGRMSVEEYNIAALDLVPIDVGPEEMAAFARETGHPRAGLLELVDWAHWNGWLVTVVSNGFDLTVDPVLDDLGLDRIARHRGRTARTYRWRARYVSPRGIQVHEGFKLSYAAAFRSNGDFVAYCGDGASDVPAARMAKVVFARDTLWERLRDDHPRCYPFETFHDVVTVLQRDAAGWLAEFHQQTGER